VHRLLAFLEEAANGFDSHGAAHSAALAP
jgi:hypothetical protein